MNENEIGILIVTPGKLRITSTKDNVPSVQLNEYWTLPDGTYKDVEEALKKGGFNIQPKLAPVLESRG